MISSPFRTKIYNDSILHANFPSSLKLADVIPANKKDDRAYISNYRSVSILPTVTKVFERLMHDQLSTYINKYLSLYLCGFRTYYCLSLMLERWKSGLDKRKIASALLTDLTKAFDCLTHELLIAKIDAYGFSHSYLALFFSYLSGRKQLVKIKNPPSSCSNITT